MQTYVSGVQQSGVWSPGSTRDSYLSLFPLSRFLALFQIMVFRLFTVRTQPREIKKKKKKTELSPGFQVGLPDALLTFGFDSSREAEV